MNQNPTQIPNIPVPREVIAYTQQVCADMGLSLDKETELAIARDVYAEHQQSASLAEEAPVWSPINDLQNRALASEAFELYCGGRARSGKSDLILGASFTDHQDSIIFRTDYGQIKALRDRSREILRGTGATYNGTDKLWKGIPGNRTLEFGALRLDSDVDKFFGRPHDLICFDEIPKFREDHYLTVWGWACAADPKNFPNQRVRIICTGNPPTETAEYWVKKRWAAWVDDKHPNPAKPGELRWYVNLNDEDTEVAGEHDIRIDETGTELKPVSRTFIPGELLHFYKGTPYEATLDALPEKVRRALRDGDFSVAEDDQAHQVIPAEHVRAAMDRWTPDHPGSRQPLSAIGVDVARGGKDATTISKRYANWFDKLLKFKGSETKTGDQVASLIMEHTTDAEKDAPIIIDLAGVGSSPYDILNSHDFRVEGFVGGSRSGSTDKSGRLGFINRRAEAWWLFKEALEPESGEEIALPPDNELLADLTAPTWELSARGIQIEDKAKLSKRLGRSPDCGDAVVMNYNSVARRQRLFLSYPL